MDCFDWDQIRKNTKWYTNRHGALRAPLGGIGTGNISLDAAGRLCDFELFGHPDKGVKYPYNFFCVWVKPDGAEGDARLLEARREGFYTQALGVPSGDLPGLPRFESSRYCCQYPYSHIEFVQQDYPVSLSLEAFTPFIPLDADASSLPGFCLTYTARNNTHAPVEVSVAGTLYNLYGFTQYDGIDYVAQDGEAQNEWIQDGRLSGISLGGSGLDERHIGNGGMCIATPEREGVYGKPRWKFGGWWDGAEEFWQDFRREGTLCADVDSEAVGSRIASSHKRHIGSLAVKKRIQPGESADFRFYVCWSFPNRYGWWPDGHNAQADLSDKPVFRNYYTDLWPSAWAAARHFECNFDWLNERSRAFMGALYGSTLDPDLIESLVQAATVIRTCTCFRLSDGAFYGWEGCFDHQGSCFGNCTHVWNYAQALAFLFPELERSMRETEFLREVEADGRIPFRAKLDLSGERYNMLPAADGHLGCVLRAYREWKLGAGDKFLRSVWPGVQSAIRFALRNWDLDGDLVMEYQQHNTYDIEFYGVSSLTNTMLYAALEAGARMADWLGESAVAQTWRKVSKSGSQRMDEMLFNGEYYEQAISDEDFQRYQYQYGKGCLSDQVFGQQLAHLYDLGYLLPEHHVRSAVRSIFEHNFLPDLRTHYSVQRGFACQDEAGLVLCSWPRGGRPRQPFVYSDEVWTGIEHQVATHLIYEGMTDEALRIERAVRARYDGYRRNPYDEIECGHHYARSMAAWGLLVALSGYRFDLPAGELWFEPCLGGEFSCFYSNERSWGVYRQGVDERGRWFQLTPLGGNLDGIRVNGLPWRKGRIYPGA